VDNQLLNSELEEVVQLGSLHHTDFHQKGIIDGFFLIQVFLILTVGFTNGNILMLAHIVYPM